MVRTDDNPTPEPPCVHERNVIAQLSGIADRIGVGKLEINAGGQFGFVQDGTGAPLNDQLADLLVKGAS